MQNIFQENWTNNFSLVYQSKDVHWKFLTNFFYSFSSSSKKKQFSFSFPKIRWKVPRGKWSRHFDMKRSHLCPVWKFVRVSVYVIDDAISWEKFISIFQDATLLFQNGAKKSWKQYSINFYRIICRIVGTAAAMAACVCIALHVCDIWMVKQVRKMVKISSKLENENASHNFKLDKKEGNVLEF